MKIIQYKDNCILLATYWNLPYKIGDLDYKNSWNLVQLGNSIHEKPFI
jgi:hypothetical protein